MFTFFAESLLISDILLEMYPFKKCEFDLSRFRINKLIYYIILLFYIFIY